MKVTYVRGWTSPLCDVKLSCPQKRPYSYLEHTRRRANVRRAFTSTSSILLTDMLVSRVVYTMSQGH